MIFHPPHRFSISFVSHSIRLKFEITIIGIEKQTPRFGYRWPDPFLFPNIIFQYQNLYEQKYTQTSISRLQLHTVIRYSCSQEEDDQEDDEALQHHQNDILIALETLMVNRLAFQALLTSRGSHSQFYIYNICVYDIAFNIVSSSNETEKKEDMNCRIIVIGIVLAPYWRLSQLPNTKEFRT